VPKKNPSRAEGTPGSRESEKPFVVGLKKGRAKKMDGERRGGVIRRRETFNLQGAREGRKSRKN